MKNVRSDEETSHVENQPHEPAVQDTDGHVGVLVLLCDRCYSN